MKTFDQQLAAAFMAGVQSALAMTEFDESLSHDDFLIWRRENFPMPDVTDDDYTKPQKYKVISEEENRRGFRQVMGGMEDTAAVNRYEKGMGL